MLLGSIGPREEYQPLEIRVFAPNPAGDQYPVEMSAPGWRDFPPGTLRLDRAELTALTADAAGYGQALGRLLFADGALGAGYRESIAAVQGRGDGLRVRLRLDPPELHAVHWERVYHPLAGAWRPLGITATTPFSRYVTAQGWERPLPVTERPLRALVVIASPPVSNRFNLDPIAEEERRALHRTWEGLLDVAVTYLETGTAAPPTLSELRRMLPNEFHVVHFLCHGAATPAGTVLYLEDDGEVAPVAADQLVSSFKALRQPPLLCFLAACESAARGRTDAFVPLGPALVGEGGIQAVVAMSDRVGVETARHFADQFYTRLLKHGVVDLALNEARALVQDAWDWGVPVLFSRLPDNQLLDFPVAEISRSYLAHTDRAFVAADEALARARRQDHGQQLVDDLQQLIEELSKSHKVLVDFASDFRRVGNDAATYAGNFEAFYYKFKNHYDSEAWVDADTSCRKIRELRDRALPALRPLLDDATFEPLRAELDLLADSDTDLLTFFRTYLDAMNAAVEEIWTKLGAGDLPGAILSKRDFEAQISPSFRRSKATLGQMTGSLGHVSA